MYKRREVQYIDTNMINGYDYNWVFISLLPIFWRMMKKGNRMKNILIIGGEGTLRDELEHKLSREGNHVSLLTNGKRFPKKPRQYSYDYESDSVREAMDSSNPEVVIFLGAYDPLFSWTIRSEQKDYKAYTSGLSNVLRWAEATGVQRFVYLSSECVYEDHYLAPINEDTLTTPRSTKGVAVSLGESMVENYANHQRMDTVIVRLAHLYMTPANRQECSDVYTKLCLQAAAEGRMKINAKIKRSALYINDAVYALLQLVAAPVHERGLYHVTADAVVTEADAAEMIQSAASRKVVVDDQTVGMEHCVLLADNHFAGEFTFQARNTLADTIPRIMQKIQGNIRQYTAGGKTDREENRSILSRVFTRMVPFLEALVVFMLAVLAEKFLSENSFFTHVDFFMLFVLLFSLVHGLQQSIFTAALSVVGYFLIHFDGGNQLQLLMDVGTYVWIAQIFIVGMSVGHLKDRLQQLQSDKDDEINYLALRLGDISDINKSNVAIKNYFEQQTINSTESLGYFYDIVAKLDEANENEVMFVAVQLLAQVMGTQDVAIYSMGSSGYCRLLTSMGGQNGITAKSLRIREYMPVFEALEKEHVFINRTVDDRLPVMASGITNQDGELSFVIFLWNLPYERMTLHYSNTLRIVSLLIRSAVERTTNYLAALTNERYLKRTNILQAAAFRDIYQVYENARQKGLTDFALLKVGKPAGKVKSLGKTAKERVLLELMKKSKYLHQSDELLQTLLRQMDYVGSLEDETLYILLTNTNRAGSDVVIRRLEENGLEAALIDKLPDKE